MFRLARELGMTVAQIERMSARELMEWNVFLSLKEEDTTQTTVEQDLMRVFGGKRG